MVKLKGDICLKDYFYYCDYKGYIKLKPFLFPVSI